MISEQVDRWRDDRTHDLEAGLVSFLDVAAADLAAQLTDLRSAARDLLDLELAVDPGAALLRPGPEFWYDFDPRIGFGPPVPEVARKAIPGRSKRVRTRLLDEIPQLADRQVGRARADLQSDCKPACVRRSRNCVASTTTPSDGAVPRSTMPPRSAKPPPKSNNGARPTSQSAPPLFTESLHG
ncbi:MAG TPA: hypothetical protein VES02_01005 [Dermatophilaceae bacterium]|nr:hypothetical protein [Dermatophilaceae bacterium]